MKRRRKNWLWWGFLLFLKDWAYLACYVIGLTRYFHQSCLWQCRYSLWPCKLVDWHHEDGHNNAIKQSKRVFLFHCPRVIAAVKIYVLSRVYTSHALFSQMQRVTLSIFSLTRLFTLVPLTNSGLEVYLTSVSQTYYTFENYFKMRR